MNFVKFNYRHTIFACYIGYITQAIINNLTPLLFLIFKKEFGISLSEITLLVTINFGVQLLVDFLSARYVDRIGYRRSVIIAHICAALGLLGMAWLPGAFMCIGASGYMGLVVSVVIYAIGGGLIEVLISPIVEACPTDDKVGAMSMLHSFYCWGTVVVVLLSTIFLHFFGKGSWHILACCWAVVPILNVPYFSMVPINTLTEDGEGMGMLQIFKSKLFWILFVLMIAAGASEQGMSQWASAFAESSLNISKAAGDIAGPCFFSTLMGIARALNGKFSERINLFGCMIGSGVLCILSYLLAVFAPVPILSLIGCGVCGFSVGIMWPGVFSMAAHKMPKGGTAMFAFLALAGDVGCSGGPTVVGMVANKFGDNLKAGLLWGMIFPVILILFCFLYRQNGRSSRISA